MKTAIISMMLMVTSFDVFCCDICGGIGSNVSAGMLLNERFHLLGIRSVNRMTTSYLEGIRHSRELIFSQEVYTRIQTGKRFQFIGVIPYQSALQKRDLGQDMFSGLGDPYVIVNGILLHRKDSTGATKSFLSVGAGVKFPAGKFNAETDGFQNLYPGTGSWDVLSSLSFVQVIQGKWSLQTEGGYSFKHANSAGFRYGNTLTSSVQVTHSSGFKGRRVIYGLGGYFDHFEQSSSTKIELGVNDNSGYISGIRANLNYLTTRWLFSAQVNFPLFQLLNAGNVRSNGAVNIGIHYLLKTNIK